MLDAWSQIGAENLFAGLWFCTVLPVEEKNKPVVLKMKYQNPFGLRNYYI